MDLEGGIGKIRGLFLTALFVLLVFPAEGQLIRVKSLVSSDSLMIGEQVEYTLRVDADSHVEFSLPQIVDTLSSAIEVLSGISSDTTVSDGRTVVENSFMITGFEPGSQIVPSQEVIYTREGVSDTARSMPLIVHIYEPEVDTSQQIRPIKAPINTPVSFREVLPWAASGLGGLLVIALIIWLLIRFLKRKKDPDGFFNKPLEPAHVIAFRELDRLKEEKIWSRGEVKHYYSQLTEITRRYIERQYDIPAMESTTDEILDAFRRSNPDDKLLDEMLKDLLELADLVKFAKEDPLPVDNQTNLNNAYLLVQKTYPLFYRDDTYNSNDLKEPGDE